MTEKVIKLVAVVGVLNGVGLITDGIGKLVESKRYRRGFEDGVNCMLEIAKIEVELEERKKKKGLFSIFSDED